MKRHHTDNSPQRNTKIHKHNFHDVLAPEILTLIMLFVDKKDRREYRLISHAFDRIITNLPKVEFIELWNEINHTCYLPLDEFPPSQSEIEEFERYFGVELPWEWKVFFSKTNGRPNWNDQLFHPSNVILPIEEWDYANIHQASAWNYHSFIPVQQNNIIVASKEKLFIGCLTVSNFTKSLLLNLETMQLTYQNQYYHEEPVGTLTDWLYDIRTMVRPIKSFYHKYGSDKLDKALAKECHTVEQALELMEKNPYYYTALSEELRMKEQVAEKLILNFPNLLHVSLKKNEEFLLSHARKSRHLFFHASRNAKQYQTVQDVFNYKTQVK